VTQENPYASVDPEVLADKVRAETEAARAQARLHTANTTKAEAEARKAVAEARYAEVEAEENERSERAVLAKDEHHRVYRFTDSVGSASVRACVERLTRWHREDPDCDIEVIFTSPGGSIIDGFVLFDFLRSLSNQGHKVTTGCLGMAASMAGILLQAGDHRWVGSEGWVMIHRAAFGAAGKTFDIEDEVAWVKRIEKRIIDIFVKRSNGTLTAAKIRRNWDRKDWWIDSDEALTLNLVDEVR
jgi:ATP-dependent Clp endopeptidase proteolytic subunit ClpP